MSFCTWSNGKLSRIAPRANISVRRAVELFENNLQFLINIGAVLGVHIVLLSFKGVLQRLHKADIVNGTE